MQLEPHRVVRLDGRTREPLAVAGPHASERDRESWPVPVEAGHLVAEPGAHRLDPAVDRGQRVDDAGVVAGVGVVVEPRRRA